MTSFAEVKVLQQQNMLGGLVCREGDWGSAQKVLVIPLGSAVVFTPSASVFPPPKYGWVTGIHWMDCMSTVVDFSDCRGHAPTIFPFTCTYFMHVLLFLVLCVVLLIGGPSTWYPQGCKTRVEFHMCKRWKPTLIPSGNVGTLQRRPIYHIGFAPVSEEGSTYIHCIA